jgi:hypothetical protein
MRLDELGDIGSVEADVPPEFDEADLAIGNEFLKSALRDSELCGSFDGV